MGLRTAPRAAAFEMFIAAQQKKDVLRFITCGSVDDGKSTLIGRLLHDTKHLLDDQVAALKRDSRKGGHRDGELDLALLVDGLAAEREQGITIDVAYRFFSTDKRTFIVADTPGHEQYTRNMATGASTADLAVLLVDARKGLTEQTRRHTLIVAMLGIRRVVLAVNKMDLVGWSQDRFGVIDAAYRSFAASLGFDEILSIPLSAMSGDNVAYRAPLAAWYGGPTLIASLEGAPTSEVVAGLPFRFPVQWVSRPNADFRGYAGTVVSGTVAQGQEVAVGTAHRRTRVARIVTADGDLVEARAGQAVTLVLADEVDISRGDLIAGADARPQVADWLDTRLFWMGETPLRLGASFHVNVGPASAIAVVEAIHRRIDPNTAAAEPAALLAANDIGDVVLALDRAVAFDSYASNRETGALILIDRESADTVGMGLISTATAWGD